MEINFLRRAGTIIVFPPTRGRPDAPTVVGVSVTPVRTARPSSTLDAMPSFDPWQWHEYATRVASVERTAWDTAAAEVEHAAADVRALVALRRGGRAVGALGSRLGLTSGGATKLCRRLCELGLVERQDIAEDLRGVRVQLTESGRRVADEAAVIYARQVRARAPEMRAAS